MNLYLFSLTVWKKHVVYCVRVCEVIIFIEIRSIYINIYTLIHVLYCKFSSIVLSSLLLWSSILWLCHRVYSCVLV